MVQRKYKQKISPTQQVLLASVLFVAAAILAQQPTLSDVESDVFFAFYNLPGWLYLPMYIITQFGSIYVLGTLLILYLIRQHYHIVIRLLMSGTLAYLLAGFAKSMWGRARPHELLSNVTILDYIQGAGFPSGHVALATALGLTVGHYLPRKYSWVPVAWIGGVAISRMYLGAHLPLDIIGGFAIGWLSYALFRHVRLYDVYRQAQKPSQSTRTAKSASPRTARASKTT